MHTTAIDPITADLLHTAVHDLKGPANRLRLLTQLLGRGAALDEDARKLLGHMQDSAATIDVVAEGLRRYADICARPPRPEPLDLGRPLASAMANLRAEIEAARAEITSTALPDVEADPFLMTWLFQELLTNAIRFRAAGAPRVHVSLEKGDRGYVSVSDNGPGIDAGMQERIFRPFKKLSRGQGAGLGLAICRRIVEVHEGRIWVEPRNGGAEFRFFVGGAAAGRDECLPA